MEPWGTHTTRQTATLAEDTMGSTSGGKTVTTMVTSAGNGDMTRFTEAHTKPHTAWLEDTRAVTSPGKTVMRMVTSVGKTDAMPLEKDTTPCRAVTSPGKKDTRMVTCVGKEDVTRVTETHTKPHTTQPEEETGRVTSPLKDTTVLEASPEVDTKQVTTPEEDIRAVTSPGKTVTMMVTSGGETGKTDTTLEEPCQALLEAGEGKRWQDRMLTLLERL